MNAAPDIALKLLDSAQQYNRGLAFDAGLKAILGLGFSLLTFGFVFWFGWFLGLFVAGTLGLQAWQFGVVFTVVFLIAATWSAWRRVDPLAGLKPLSEKELMLTLVSQAAGLLYFSPRHASAGAAVVLIGGPAAILQALGIWTYRIRLDSTVIDEAAEILAACKEKCPAKAVRRPAAVLLLRRLRFIKVIPDGESVAFTVTDAGHKVLSGAKPNAAKRSTGRERSKPPTEE